VLRPILETFDPANYPELVVGLSDADDAAVWRLEDGRLLIVTTDFFTPVVDTAFEYGAIAAANAISDVYAMGGVPLFALNILAIPPSLPGHIVQGILRGGAEKVKEAGAVLAGGHSVQDDEPKYGLVVIGLVDEAHLMRKNAARPGDVLVLTKPLGTGVTTTALRNNLADESDIDQAIRWMSQLSDRAGAASRAAGVKAATDVTGFSLLGHGLELAKASGVGLRFFLQSIPFLAGARKYAEKAQFPGGSADNRMFFGDQVTFDASIDEYNRMLLFDAQTSGGLLLALPEASLELFASECACTEVPFWYVGEVIDGSGARVVDQKFQREGGHSSGEERIWFPGEQPQY
jgi:selenide,water dikinase